MSSGAFLKLAIIWSIEKKDKSAKKALDKATDTCPGYAQHPDIKDLLTKT